MGNYSTRFLPHLIIFQLLAGIAILTIIYTLHGKENMTCVQTNLQHASYCGSCQLQDVSPILNRKRFQHSIPLYLCLFSNAMFIYNSKPGKTSKPARILPVAFSRLQSPGGIFSFEGRQRMRLIPFQELPTTAQTFPEKSQKNPLPALAIKNVLGV